MNTNEAKRLANQHLRPWDSPWPGVLDAEAGKESFHDLMEFVKRERDNGQVCPEEAKVFEAFRLTPYERVRVVILGQDPYPNRDQAMGLCFSVQRSVDKTRSLINIDAALVASGYEPLAHGDLTAWAEQGVILLNAALTVPEGSAGKHMKKWQPFTDAVIKLVSDRPGPPIVFVLWGRKAQRVKEKGLINERHHVLTAPHPAARGQAQQAFRDYQTFRQVNALLPKSGPRIDWSVR